MTFLLVLLPAVATGAPAEFQSLASIHDAAAGYLMRQAAPGTAVDVAPLDERLRLPACGQALQAATRHASASAATVAVQCADPAWTVYVSVRLSLHRAVVVLRRPTARGEPLTSEHIATEQRELSGAQGFYTDPAQVVGKILRRPLVPGSVLSPEMLAAPVLVRRGELVTLLGRSGAMEVRAQAKALADGTEGQAIQVQNTASGRVVGGVVRSAGLVEVNL
jgi:flagellar basal body P-ring formation protein FlgA